MDADDDYFRYPVGSPKHYAAYEKYFKSQHGIDCVFPGDPESPRTRPTSPANSRMRAGMTRCAIPVTSSGSRKAPGGGARGEYRSRKTSSMNRGAGWTGTGGSLVSRTPTTAGCPP
jgi:hypothetical protein